MNCCFHLQNLNTVTIILYRGKSRSNKLQRENASFEILDIKFHNMNALNAQILSIVHLGAQARVGLCDHNLSSLQTFDYPKN